MTTQQELLTSSQKVEQECQAALLRQAINLIDRGLLAPAAASGLYSATVRADEILTQDELTKCNRALPLAVNSLNAVHNGIKLQGWWGGTVNFNWSYPPAG